MRLRDSLLSISIRGDAKKAKVEAEQQQIILFERPGTGGRLAGLGITGEKSFWS